MRLRSGFMARKRGERFRVLADCENFYVFEERRLGFILRDMRVGRGWSQSDMAEKLSEVGWAMHQTNVSKIEAGKHPLRVADVQAFARVLEVPAAVFWSLPADNEPPGIRELREQLEADALMVREARAALDSAAAHYAWALGREADTARRIGEAAQKQVVTRKGSR